MAVVPIIGGPFQDASGNALSNGYLVFQLQHDAAAAGTGQIVGQASVRVQLNDTGSIPTSPPVNMWPNDLLVPAGGTYLVWAYDSSNRLVWDNPQVQQILSSPNPFNLNAWVPGP